MTFSGLTVQRLGLLLYAVVRPVVLAFLFYVMITPIGMLLRALRTNLLSLRWEPEAKSYWIPRRSPGPAPETMKNQF